MQNKQKALRILRAKLFQLQRETADMERSVTRKRQIGTAERSEKIRTYNFPQVSGNDFLTCAQALWSVRSAFLFLLSFSFLKNRVTDHRAGVSSKNIEDFLKGGEELRHMITALRSHYRTIALDHILQEYKKE